MPCSLGLNAYRMEFIVWPRVLLKKSWPSVEVIAMGEPRIPCGTQRERFLGLTKSRRAAHLSATAHRGSSKRREKEDKLFVGLVPVRVDGGEARPFLRQVLQGKNSRNRAGRNTGATV